MAFQQGTAYAESDADDEYERDIHDSSPIDITESELSPTETDLASAEHTPTTYGYRSSADRLPETIITDWTAEECADFVATIGLQQYADNFIENEIVGEALIALLHDDLKQMGITSVGHRLTILKSVYEVKKAQEVPIESDHYLPLTAETEAQSTMATLKDIKSLVEQLRLRDERMSLFEQDFRRLADDYRRLREDVLPALRLVKDAQQPLPHVNNDQSYNFEATISPPVPTPQSAGQHSISIKRQYSTRKMVPTGTTPKTTSPTHLQTTHDRMHPEQTLDPSNAAERAVLSSQHLAAANGGGQAISPSYPSPNSPSPTSPPSMNGTTLASRSYRSDQPTPSSRSTFAESHHRYAPSTREKDNGAPQRNPTPAPDTPGNASVEIFKSFRVSMDDPCYKVLPAALRRYQINAPPDQYALYIVYGDQERCLALNEKPLILFKQLDKEGKKPMFMLRKTANAQVDLPTDIPGSAGLNAAARGASTGYDPPGGII
ncbi:protein kinase regulator ste50 [Ophiostoma piceae UAMH 11346]|uniref:Protein kinase regulator ste50 n=1 Tax=Ophiostoma piceae (strain UAMH 11346) TaxID=1262450 RepID=S3C1B1_OPHP1|nr:protein kinase regulator ste50 [Ophiostoma piceae UAMH 11346]